MAVFIVAQIRYTDEARYRRYQNAFPAIFLQSGGRLLAADEKPRILEGHWDRDKVVLMEFPSKEVASKFLNSSEYRAISKDREAGAETIGLLVQGV